MAKATLKIYGDIGTVDPMFEMFSMSSDMIGSKEVSQFLDDNKEATEITVRINSRGGDVQEGWCIYDLLTTSGKKITTVGEGKVYSIATIIFLAGSEREMLKNADGLIHNPYIPPYTLADAYESSDLIKIAEELAQEEEKILDFYAQKTGTDKAKLAEYMKDETKLSAEDMVTLGFATKVVEPIKAFAYIKPKNNFMTPDQEKSFFERLGSALDNAVAKVAGFSRLPASAQELTDKDGNVLKLEKETGAPAVGDLASPDGTYTMSDGSVVTVADGKVTEVSAPEEEMTDLEKANAEIEKLKGELTTATQALEAEKAAIAAEKETIAAQVTEYSALITELRAIKNEWKPDGRTNNTGKTDAKKTGIDMDQVKEIIKAINSKK